MKVGFLLNKNDFKESSASANRWKNIITGLSNNDVKIILFIVGGYQSNLEKRDYSHFDFCNIIYLDTTVYDLMWKKRLKTYVFDKILTFFQAKKLKKYSIKLNLDFLFLNGTNESLSVYDFAFRDKPNSFKIIFEMNEDPEALDVHITNILQRKKLLKQKKLLANRIFKDSDCCFFMTQNLMNKYSKLITNSNNTSYLLPMSVDFQRFQNMNKDSNSDFYIAYCGSSSFSKDGVDILVKAFEILAKQNSEIKLKIAAFWENDGGKLMSLINQSESKKIEYIGALSKDDIPQFILNASILVLPRPNSEQAKYGFPTKLGEYLATGNPVCCTRVGEIDNFLKDRYSVYFAEPGSVESLATTLQAVIVDRNKAIEVGNNGNLVALEHFDKEKQGKFLKRVLMDKLSAT